VSLKTGIPFWNGQIVYIPTSANHFANIPLGVPELLLSHTTPTRNFFVFFHPLPLCHLLSPPPFPFVVGRPGEWGNLAMSFLRHHISTSPWNPSLSSWLPPLWPLLSSWIWLCRPCHHGRCCVLPLVAPHLFHSCYYLPPQPHNDSWICVLPRGLAMSPAHREWQAAAAVSCFEVWAALDLAVVVAGETSLSAMAWSASGGGRG